ncbi:MAG: prolipoprotein diacylglyceryl transferase [Alphaproteobacteria bacterium]|nr:prolipoprotein diacylglyceryl transferase [Alphaproteobacteria bacterium]
MSLTFPAIDPVALWIGPLPLRWYALAYVAGFLLGWRYALYLSGLDEKHNPTREQVDDFLPWAILGVILGGRIGYALFYQFDLYLSNPLEVLKVWHGGMAFHGGALGVILALIIYPLVKKFNPFRLADIVCACVPIGLFFGRIANFINGELFGRVSDVPWAMVFPRGGPEARHPSQLYEAALEGALLFLILFVLIRIKAVRDRPGIVSGAFLAGYGCFRAIVELFREPDAQIGFLFDVFSMGQLLSAPMIIAGVCLAVAGYLGYTEKRA